MKTPEQLAHDREYQRVKYATDPAARERKRVRNAARSLTVEGRGERWEENQRRTRRARAQRIADYDAMTEGQRELILALERSENARKAGLASWNGEGYKTRLKSWAEFGSEVTRKVNRAHLEILERVERGETTWDIELRKAQDDFRAIAVSAGLSS